MHIIPPDCDRFPILATAQYKPTPHTLSDAKKFYTQTSGLAISEPRMVLTQVSIYGTDNSALLSGLSELGNSGRGVVECDAHAVSENQLSRWWQQGVRGIRINLVSVSRSIDEEELRSLLQAYVDKLAPMPMPAQDKKWVIEMYTALSDTKMLLAVLPTITNGHRVRFCLDHFAGLKFKDDAPDFEAGGVDDADVDDGVDPYLIPGFRELIQLLTDVNLPEVYLKLSAAYRVDASYPSRAALRRLDPIGRELVSKAEDRVCWASDWPHTRFGNIDSVPFVELCYAWCGEGAEGGRRREKLFRDNSGRLWDMA